MMKNISYLGVVQNCQHLGKHTESMLGVGRGGGGGGGVGVCGGGGGGCLRPL